MYLANRHNHSALKKPIFVVPALVAALGSYFSANLQKKLYEVATTKARFVDRLVVILRFDQFILHLFYSIRDDLGSHSSPIRSIIRITFGGSLPLPVENLLTLN
jgi:hypothetical protein